MRNLMVTFAALALAAITAAGIFWCDLNAERLLNAELQDRLAAIDRRRPESVAAARPVEVAAVPEESRPAATRKASPATRGTADVVTADVVALMRNQREMLKDPEYRKARLAQTRLTLPRQYPGLMEALGLSPDEAGKLFDLLADSELKMEAANPLPFVNGQIDQAAMQETMRTREEMQHQQDDAVLALLGSSKYAQWQDYQSTRTSRMQAAALGQNMEAAGQPLTAVQMQSLTTAMAVEQKRQTEDMQALLHELGPLAPDTQGKFQDESLRLQDERNHRLVDAITGSLNARQLETVKTMLDQQVAMSRASNRIVRQQAASLSQDQ